MELRHLRYFVAVAEELSFTAAAARLHMSQPPLSQQIRDLELELQADLFRRTSRRVELTPAGQAFLQRARSILIQVDQAAAEARAIGLGSIGTLDIGMTGSILLGPLAPLLASYSEKHSKVDVRLHEMSPLDQIAAIHARRVDVSFLRSPLNDPDLVTELAWPERVGVALPTTHPLAMREHLNLVELSDETFIFLRLRDSPFAEYLRRCCIDVGFMPKISHEVVEAYSLTSLVATGMGVALVPESVGRLSRRDIIYRPLLDRNPVADVKMVYRQDSEAVVRQFIEASRVFLRAATSA
jgi:DNA-binding transcriptional LysR family regulator